MNVNGTQANFSLTALQYTHRNYTTNLQPAVSDGKVDRLESVPEKAVALSKWEGPTFQMKTIEKSYTETLNYRETCSGEIADRIQSILDEAGLKGTEEMFRSCALCYTYMERSVVIENPFDGSLSTVSTYSK